MIWLHCQLSRKTLTKKKLSYGSSASTFSFPTQSEFSVSVLICTNTEVRARKLLMNEIVEEKDPECCFFFLWIVHGARGTFYVFLNLARAVLLRDARIIF